MARGATWDITIEQRIGRAIGLDARAQDANYFAGICINLPRHPAWGLIQEPYSEDPLLLGDFGVALNKGVSSNFMTCVKHFALDSMEHARFKVDVEVDDAALHEGEFAGQNEKLLTHILRDEWKFEGFVLLEFVFGLRDAVLSVKNGLDIEAPFSQQHAISLRQALDSGELDWLSTVPAQECYGSSWSMLRAPANTPQKMGGQQILPIDTSSISKLAIIGKLANTANTGARGSSAVFAPRVVTVYEGLGFALPGVKVILEDRDSLAICIVGYDAADEGEYVVPSFQDNPELLKLLPPATTDREKEMLEMTQGQMATDIQTNGDGLVLGAGGDRKDLRSWRRDIDSISAVTDASPKAVVSVVAAGAVSMEDFISRVPALLMTWYARAEGGHALADVLLGRVGASGRLPFSIPTSEDHLPHFDIKATSITYDRWFGQRLLDKLGIPARFPLGFGLSYTTFSASTYKVLAGPAK
ncbi:Periplasmic beta-glucosidase [Elsinoe australis]|uniref:beta-glucosidase n=1 Tax=Elsinoe australis TaxID=40998 RepID=A0A2P7YKV8_9PEZI|nr:Periplasmic beta-glucosidase [Elsinoe australis]